MQRKIIKVTPSTVEFDLFPTRLDHTAIAKLDMALRPLKPRVRKLVWVHVRGRRPIEAGFGGQRAAEILAYPAVQNAIAVINSVLAESAVSDIQERKATLTKVHRGTVGDFLEVSGRNVDMKLDANLSTPSLKSVTVKKDKHGVTETKIEIRDPVAAIEALNRMEGVYRPEQNTGEKVVVILDYRRTRRKPDDIFDDNPPESQAITIEQVKPIPPVSVQPPGGEIVKRGAMEAVNVKYIP